MIESNRFRGRALPVPVTPANLLCITIAIPDALEYRAAFFGQLDELGYWWAWEHPTDGTECADCEEAAQLWRTAIFEAQRGICGGEEPVTTNCCTPSVADRISTMAYVGDTSTTYNTNYAQYLVDGLETIAPQMGYDFSDPGDIDKFMCLGLKMMMKAIMDTTRGVKNAGAAQSQNLLDNVGLAMGGLAAAGGIALTLGGVAAGVVSFIGGPWMLLGLAIGGVATQLASTLITADTAALDNTEAIDKVLCTMRENTQGVDPTFTAFQGLLTPNSFTGDEIAIATIVQPFLNDVTFYVQFMMALSELKGGGDGSIFDNLQACEDCPVTGDNCGDWFEYYGTITGETGTYIDVQMQAISGGYKFQVQSSTNTAACLFNGWSVQSGTFTIWPQFAPFTNGVRFTGRNADGSLMIDSGDSSLVNWRPSIVQFFSTTPCTIRLLVS